MLTNRNNEIECEVKKFKEKRVDNSNELDVLRKKNENFEVKRKWMEDSNEFKVLRKIIYDSNAPDVLRKKNVKFKSKFWS